MSVQVTVYTGTGSSKVINTEAAKWGDLINDLSRNGVSYNSGNTKAVIGETEVTLESNDAVLPTDNFTLFLLPQKVKSGYEESYEDSYNDEGEDEGADAPSSAPVVSPENWTKGDALAAIQQTMQKLSDIQRYVQSVSSNPLDEKAKQLMNKLVG
jgi:hypothetical protein